MKKSLLFAAFIMSATLVNAQSLKSEKIKAPSISERISSIMAEPTVTALDKGGKAVSRRSKASGTYYKRPDGTMYYCWDEEGRGYGNTLLVANPFVDTKFVPQMENPSSAKWHLNYVDRTGVTSGSYDISILADENGVLSFPSEIGSWYAVPTLVNGTDSFALGQIPYDEDNYIGNYYWTQNKYYFTRLITDSIAPHSFVDDHSGSSYHWGLFTPKNPLIYYERVRNYLFGSGTYQMGEGEDSVATFAGVQQYFEKPQTPLYVENVFIRDAFMTGTQILPEGGKLVMTITNAVYNADRDIYVAGEKVFAQMEATANDLFNIASETLGDGTYTGFGIKFANKYVDEYDDEYVEGFIIDDAFMVTITGFDAEGVDVCICGYENPAEDELESTYVIYNMGDKTYVGPFYSGSLSLPIVFNSFFDHAEVWKTAYSADDSLLVNLNVLNVSTDGTNVSNNALSELPGVFVNTALSWFNSDDEENYFLFTEDGEEIPEWITSISTYDEVDEDYGVRTGREMLSVACEALPAGVKGRYTKLYVYGIGAKSTVPVIIIQGEIDESVETLSVESSMAKGNRTMGKTFNLKGQVVKATNKGIVVRDGKKMLVK